MDFEEIRRKIEKTPQKSIILLENLRFWPGEKEHSVAFAKQLSDLANYYVNDAFAVCHRDSASVETVTKFLPSYAGLELEEELKVLDAVQKSPKQPLVVILGGAKAHDKLGVISNLESKASAFLIGGAAANTFMKLKGIDVRGSLIDDVAADYGELKKVMEYPSVVLPVDWREEKGSIFDIGPKSSELFASYIKKAKTIIWNGPVGFSEKKKFARGSSELAKAIIANKKAVKIAGGGETVVFLKSQKLDKKFNFISTGGGAMLDYLSGKVLPGILALKR
jgi:phosphoglycerate kinase